MSDFFINTTHYVDTVFINEMLQELVEKNLEE